MDKTQMKVGNKLNEKDAMKEILNAVYGRFSKKENKRESAILRVVSLTGMSLDIADSLRSKTLYKILKDLNYVWVKKSRYWGWSDPDC